MPECGHCSEKLPPENDFVSCGECKGKYHYGCAGMRETVWRKYNLEAKAAWRCVICKTKTTSDNADLIANKDTSTPDGLVDVNLKGNSANFRNTGSAQKNDEVSYLKELIRHKDIIITNQADLIYSLKEQIKLLQIQAMVDVPHVPKQNTGKSQKPKDVAPGKQSENFVTPESLTAPTNTRDNRQLRVSVKPKTVVSSNGGGETTKTIVGKYDMHEALTRAKLHEVIHLDKGVDDDRQWTRVSHRRKGGEFVVGKRTDDGSCELKVAELRSHWHVYRLHPDTTPDEVLNYLKTDFPGVLVEKLNSSRPSLYSSFKVTVREEDGSKMLNADLWPNGARIRRFFLPRDR